MRRTPSRAPSPTRILITVLAIVFVVEAMVMVALPALLPASVDDRVVAVVDACLLTFAAAPILWWVVIRPLRRTAVAERAKAESIVHAAVEGIVTIDSRGLVDSFNPAAEAIFGYPANEIVGYDVGVLMPEGYVARHREALRLYAQTGKATVIGRTIEVPGRRKDGSLVPLELSIGELDVGGRRIFTGILRDLTQSKARDRQQAVMVEFGRHALAGTELPELLEEAARCVAETLEADYSLVLELMPDDETLLLQAGIGWPDELIGQAIVETQPDTTGGGLLAEAPLIVDDYGNLDRSAAPPLFRDHDVVCGLSVVIQGPERPFGVLGAYCKCPRSFATDDVHFLRDIAMEVTLAVQRRRAEFRQRERDVLRAEQMAAVAQIATGVAHEIRNPLTSIKMLVQAARQSKEAPGLEPQDMAIIEEEIRRMERSLKAFLDFARPPKPERRLFDLRTLVERSFALTQSRASRQQVVFEFDPPSQPVMVEADWDQMQQLLLNLTLNALDAMPRGGTLQVELDAPSEGRLGLRVVDSGTGISPQVLPRLFQAFTTSKETGMGLGLVISRRIAEDHGGTLVARNHPQGGACFVLQLPVPSEPTT